MIREGSVEEVIPRDGAGVATRFPPLGPPKTVPRIDYERIFVLDGSGALLGEYVLRDECPLEFADLERAIPLNGMRHLVSFYQGEYVFTPFRIENLWFVVLSLGIPRIEERGAIGTLLAAMRVHLPGSLPIAYAARETRIREQEVDLDLRDALLTRREQRVTQLEADLQVAARKLIAREREVRGRESRVDALRDYAIQMQREFRRAKVPSDAANDPGNAASATGVSARLRTDRQATETAPSHDR